MTWDDWLKMFASAGIGFLVGLLGNYINEYRKTKQEKASKRARVEALLTVIHYEIGEGINRCKTIINTKEGEFSPTMVFTGAWRSISGDYFTMMDQQVIEKVHKAYYMFHLINLQANWQDFIMAKNFAKEKLPVLQQLHTELRNYIDNNYSW